jgi:hypothetical protein
MRAIFYAGLILAMLASPNLINAQRAVDANKTVQVNAEYSKEDRTITLTWENFPDAGNYLVYSRIVGSPTWGIQDANLDGGATSFTYTDMEIGRLYEFRVRRNGMTTGIGEGYIYSGIEVERWPFDRAVALIIDNTFEHSLEKEIEMLSEDLVAEGWRLINFFVPRDTTVEYIKELLVEEWNQSLDLRAVFLFGHVPVPYSGNIVPDGHSNNHFGAWPCDGYYGDMDGTWTDATVNQVLPGNPERINNVPGDGKFDQNSFPSSLELAVGRVDFANLPLFDESEEELLRKYVMKNHAFRKGEIKGINRGLVENNFNLAEGFGQNGYRNFAALVGRDSVHFRDFDILQTENYLWSYGAGAGNYQGASGISNTTNFTSDSIQTFFTMLFGSYFGDFDSNNNFLRAALATGTTLSNVWAGRPNWFFHPMGMGASLDECALISMNNSGIYLAGFSARGVHMALLGDPTIKMDYPIGASDLSVVEDNGSAILSWSPSADEQLMGYHIYRKDPQSGDIERLTESPITEITYNDPCLPVGSSYSYYLSAVRMQHTPTGCYYNESPFISDEILIQTDYDVTANFGINQISDVEVQFTNTTINGTQYFWDFGDGTTSTESSPSHIYTSSNVYQVKLVASNECSSDTLCQSLEIVVSSVKDLSKVITFYPNPADEVLFIDCKNCSGINRVEIYNDLGSLIFVQEKARVNISEVSLERVSPGVLFIRLFTDDEVYSGKLIKL